MKEPSHLFKKVLIINIFGIGDVLFTTPLISNIKAALPDSFIGYVCNKRALAALADNPKVNKIFIYEKDDYRELYKKSKIEFFKKIVQSLAEIRKEQFDYVIDLSLNKYSSFLMGLVGIKNRIGFNYKNRSPFLTHKITLAGYESKHVIEYYLDLLNFIGIPAKNRRLEFFLSDKDRHWAKEFFAHNRLKESDFVIAVVPGGGASWGKDAGFKRWSAENYAQLADKMVEKFLAKIILLGDTNEEELCRRVAGVMRQVSVVSCGMPLGRFAALLSFCQLALVNDGGPLHVAVAVGTRTASIFGPVDENVYGPYPKDRHVVITKDVPCRPCYRQFKLADCRHHNCLTTLNVNEAFENLEQNL